VWNNSTLQTATFAITYNQAALYTFGTAVVGFLLLLAI
jgi:hypothetical protein